MILSKGILKHPVYPHTALRGSASPRRLPRHETQCLRSHSVSGAHESRGGSLVLVTPVLILAYGIGKFLLNSCTFRCNVRLPRTRTGPVPYCCCGEAEFLRKSGRTQTQVPENKEVISQPDIELGTYAGTSPARAT
ncbi:hypothetical protein JYU34_003942 [Plutella xylostella]|uniref:Uncharacterized protein n=1 Tax=Plutella xylostella TaxID=51655 RepID=A0ABQ7R1A8_PLUXY|nr:hypothetical protein JYU34_003942 [Plutella xylostella]